MRYAVAVCGFDEESSHAACPTPDNPSLKILNYYLLDFFPRIFSIFASAKLSRGVIGNTSDSGSEEFRFET